MRWASAMLLFGTLAFMGFGLVMQASVGDVPGRVLHGNPLHFLRSQAEFDAAALAACAVIACIRPSFWFRRRTMWLLGAVILLSLIVVHVPGLGHKVNGSARWIRLPGLSLQPSEFVKLCAILLLAGWLGENPARNRSFWHGTGLPCLALGAVALGLLRQPDLGSAAMVLAIGGAMLFVGGARLLHLIPLGLLGAAALGIFLLNDAERKSRITSSVGRFFGGERKVLAISEDEDGYQLRMGLSAFAAGGARGVGLGNSLFKERYLPENHTDFIFAMVGEELGLAATLPCLLLYAILAAAGFYIAFRAPDEPRRFVAFGMTMLVCFSAAVNVGVVTGRFPTKGLALPFLSYGGSNLVGSVGAIGFLLAIGWRPGARRAPAPAPSAPGPLPPATDLWNG